MIKPLKSYVIGKPIEIESKSTIALLQENTYVPQQCLVVATGCDVTNVHVGDRVLYQRLSAEPLELNTERLLVIEGKDIIGVIE